MRFDMKDLSIEIHDWDKAKYTFPVCDCQGSIKGGGTGGKGAHEVKKPTGKSKEELKRRLKEALAELDKPGD
jgi:hypothetical protein